MPSKSTLLADPGESYAGCVADLERHANVQLTDTEVIAQVTLIVAFSADCEARDEVEALERGHKSAAGVHRLACARKRRLARKLTAMRALIIERGCESLAELLGSDPYADAAHRERRRRLANMGVRYTPIDSGFDIEDAPPSPNED